VSDGWGDYGADTSRAGERQGLKKAMNTFFGFFGGETTLRALIRVGAEGQDVCEIFPPEKERRQFHPPLQTTWHLFLNMDGNTETVS